MKFQFFFSMAALAVLLALIASCNDETLLQDSIAPFPPITTSIEEPGLQLHPETEIITISENKSRLNLPDGVQFVYTTIDKRSSVGGTGSSDVICTCNTGTGCDPVLYDGKYTCVMKDGCSNCSKTTSLVAGAGEAELAGKNQNTSQEMSINIHGLVDFNKGITFVTSEYTGDIIQDAFLSIQEEAYDNAFPELFELKDVQIGIKKFLNQYYDQQIPDFLTDHSKQVPADYTYIMVNIFGNIAALPFPSDAVNAKANMPGGSIGFDAGKVSCSCLSGQDGCKYETAASGKLKYCDSGNCTPCKLSS